MTLKVGMQHRVLEYFQICLMMTLSWPWPILRQGQIWSIMLLYGKKVKLELSEDPDYSPAIVLSEEKDISWTEN